MINNLKDIEEILKDLEEITAEELEETIKKVEEERWENINLDVGIQKIKKC